MSKNTKHVNVMVVSLAVISLSSISLTKMYNVPKMIIMADWPTLLIRAWVRILSFLFLGGLLITSWSTGSTPNDWAGGPSIKILIHKICMAFNGLGKPKNVDKATRVNAAIDVDNWKVMKF